MQSDYFGTDKGHIFKYDPKTGGCSLYKKLKYSVHHMVFNSDNHPLVIVPYAVYDPSIPECALRGV